MLVFHGPKLFVFLVLASSILALAGGFSRSAGAAEVMESFTAHYEILPDGTASVTEEIVWDFGAAERHGIFRYFFHRRECPSKAETEAAIARGEEQPLLPCKDGYDRTYDYDIESIDRDGSPEPYKVERSGRLMTVRIGDADRTINGRHTYVVRYRVGPIFDAYPSHDELAWRAISVGDLVTANSVRIEVEGLPPSATLGCAQGVDGRGTICNATHTGNLAVFTSTRALAPQHELSIGAAWEPGLLPFAPATFYNRPSPDDYYELDAPEIAGAGALGLVGLAGVWGFYWRNGRDRRYKTLHYLTDDARDGTKPLFARNDVVVEFLPPDDLHPGQMGVILDETADTLDVTATIVDLAVRGHITIAEVEDEKNDWDIRLVSPGPGTDALSSYEVVLLQALLPAGKEEVRVSSLKRTFSDDLARVKRELYADAVRRKWFHRNPRHQVGIAVAAGVAMAVIGALVAGGFGVFAGRGLIGVPLIVAGLLLMALSPLMAKRTAVGSEALRRVLGFRLYITTAEKRPQEFNEQQNIFARYLPYAMVFNCVDKWVKAFDGIDAAQMAAATGGWYAGAAMFNAQSFSKGMNSFAASVSATLATQPKSSSGSGFSGGGFSGGGGGGGGVGSW